MPIYEIETDQGIFEIDADREPTQEEALAAISGQSVQAPVTPRSAFTPEQGVFKGDTLLKEGVEAIPLVGSIDQFSEGMRSGKQLFGDTLGGKLTGAILGGARAAGTVLNPISVLLNAVPKTAQSIGSASGGDIDAALRSLTGSAPIQSAATFGSLETGVPALDITANTLGGISNEIAKQPLILASATPAALGQASAALRSGGSTAVDIGSAIARAPVTAARAIASPRVTIAKAIGREPVPILANVLDYTASQTDKIQSVLTKSPELLPEIKANVNTSIKNGGEKAIEAIGTTLEKRYDTYYPAIESAPEAIVAKNLGESFRNEAVTRIKAELTDNGIPEARQIEIITELSPNIDGLNNLNIIDSTKRLNRQVAPLYKPVPTPSALANDQMIARSALRDVQSEAIKNTLKDLGFDTKVYSEVGVLNEFKNQLEKKYIAAKNDLFKTQGSTLNQSLRKGLKQGLGAAVTEVSERIGAGMSRGKVGEIDRAMNLMFDQIEASPAKFQVAPPLDLETLIQESNLPQ